METITKSAGETAKLGEKIGNYLKIHPTPLVLAFSGDLGSGKTTFIQGLARGLGIKKRIVSPTFILLRSYHRDGSDNLVGKNDKQVRMFLHLDLYRLENPLPELEELGYKEAIKTPGNLICIEWAEKAKSAIPDNAIWICFEVIGEEKRKIAIDFPKKEDFKL